MLYDEFLKGTGKEDNEAMRYAYEAINKIYMSDKLESKDDCYNYFRRYASDFTWIDELQVGKGQYIEKPNYPKTVITIDEAKKIINEEFCFEIDKIEIYGTPSYDASDLQHIAFMVKGYSRIYSDGSLYDVWR